MYSLFNLLEVLLIAKTDELLINDQIRIAELMVIGPNGEKMGVKRLEDAKTLASYAGLDLVLMSENSTPAVSKIMDYNKYRYERQKKLKEAQKKQRESNKEIFVLCGRPYHVDPLICHEIDKLINGFDKAVINELCLSYLEDKQRRKVWNQWTYHARMYNAARYVCENEDMNVIQLVSFGCGLDAITTDEMKDILESKGKIYTQIKIDEITNMGAVRIRLRSLFKALERIRTYGK